MNGVIVVAPPDAAWADRAESELHHAHLLVARLYEPTLLPLLIQSGGVRAVAIDTRLATPALRVIRRSFASDSTVKLLLVQEGTHSVTVGPLSSIPWPENIAAVRELLESA